jgi:hypothetical protein
MQWTAWALVLGSALGLAGAPVPVGADAVSDVNGEAEAPVLRRVIDGLALVDRARDQVAGVFDKARLDDATSGAVAATLDQLRTAAADARELLDEGGGYQPTTDAAFAFDSLLSAASAADKLARKLRKPQKGKSVRKGLDKVEGALLAAKFSMQGVFVEEKDRLAELQGASAPATYVDLFDRGSARALLKLLRVDGSDAPATLPAAKDATWRRAPKRKARRLDAAARRDVRGSGAVLRSGKRKCPPAKAGKAPPDHFVAFSAASSKQTEPGACVVDLGREIRGEFVVAAFLGHLDGKPPKEPDGAFACLTVEVAGSGGAEYVTVCVRATATGVQVYGEVTGGEAMRTREYADATCALVRIEYDGRNFRIHARPDTTRSLDLVDTHFRRAGDDAFTVSYGAGGLLGKTRVGVDSVYVVAR